MRTAGLPAEAKAAEREAMRDAVGTTGRVLDAAIAASVPRIVYVSTCNVFGDTGDRVVDETYHRPGRRLPVLVRRPSSGRTR